MLIRNIEDTPRKPVEMAGASGASMAVMCGRADGAPNFALRQIKVEPGGYTPHHAHDYEHEVFVVDGSGTVLLEGKDRPIRRGDVIMVPANEVHQFKAAADSALHFLCLVPVTRDCGEPVPGS